MYIIFFKQKPAYYMRISDWSSDVGSSDLAGSLANISGISGRRGWANAAIFVDEEARLGKTAIEAHRLFGDDVQCTGDAFGRLVGARGAHDLNSLDELGQKPVDEKGAIGLAGRCEAAVDQHLGKAGRKAAHLNPVIFENVGRAGDAGHPIQHLADEIGRAHV